MKNYTADKIHNIVLAGHGGCGKTTLAEAMVHAGNPTGRLGRVDDGNSIFDFDIDETTRKISIFSSLAACEHQDHKLNVIDTPGYADFAGEVKAGMRVADCVIIVAQGVSGIEVGTDKCWKYSDELKLPRAIFLTRLLKEHSDFYKSLDQARDKFGHQAVPLTLPIGDQLNLKGVVDLTVMKAFLESEGKSTIGEIPSQMAEKAKEYRDKLVEAVAESDDSLMEKFLNGESLTDQEISDGLKTGIRKGSLVPVFAGDGYFQVGVNAMLNSIVAFFPTAADTQEVVAQKAGSDEEIIVKCDPNGPPVLFMFKTFIEPHAGNLNYFRMYSGSLEPGIELYNASLSKAEKFGQFYFPNGKDRIDAAKISCGDIGIAVKLKESGTGDTISTKNHQVILPKTILPKPSISVAVEAKSKDDEGKISVGLSRLNEEDPTFTYGFVPEIRQTLINGLGELHLDIMVGRLKRKFGVEVTIIKPRIPYRETISKKVEIQGKHKKQSGGHGQYGDVWLRLEPLPRGGGFEFVDEVVGGVVPGNFIPSVEKGVKAAMLEGAVAGYHIVDLKAAIYFGSYHPVDSSGTSFEIAGSMALKKGVLEASPVLLEPIMKLEVAIPEEFAGQVMGDLNSRRGRISGMDSAKGLQVIKATVPQGEMYKYSTSLRSMTQGRGSFEMEFSHYDPVPFEATQKIIEEAKKEKEEKQK
ncbi:MAG: elongation factor G [Candidatus Edwardsbacteria bacterium]|nr:elongation factor G [Candidatus Edwardsbacteria bacterium]